MEQASSATRILIAALFAVVFTLVSQLFLTSSDSTTISIIALGAFLGGALVPLLANIIPTRKASSNFDSDQSAGEGTTLYVGNLPFKTDENAVKDAFAKYGAVLSVRLVKDRRTGRKKGYGFVEMEDGAAEKALSKLNDKEFEGRTLKVRLAHSEQSE
ncbi:MULTISPECIES: RNA-binding protein [Gammaproteobacteria]|uniref:RNA recognition motif domain-containing protein n=1 Tax=Gammaproteobacteria TaxID=1236 RepID=UPI000DD0BE64|nr:MULTISPECIES: RNA-binding protein [Gammaproteobacteria]RTE85675.1 RNA-binding protein [Aliidiomarina sp. B3213]TCZ90322.1 RNA-binding protein [Lysobacter sp. N42]